MLREYPRARQIDGERRRRWFGSWRCDLIVWLHDDGSVEGFQFCYDKSEDEHALSWRQDLGYSHMAVDNGEGGRGYKGTPILIPDGSPDFQRILAIFEYEGAELPGHYRHFIAERIRELQH